MADIGFVWDEDKLEEVMRKHNISFGEAVDVFISTESTFDADPQGHPERCSATGRTKSGRLLQVIYVEFDEDLKIETGVVIRFITAFEVKETGEYK